MPSRFKGKHKQNYVWYFITIHLGTKEWDCKIIDISNKNNKLCR